MNVNVLGFNPKSIIWRRRHRPAFDSDGYLRTAGWRDAQRKVSRGTRRLLTRCRWHLGPHHWTKVVANMHMESMTFTAQGVTWAGKVLDSYMECFRCGRRNTSVAKPGSQMTFNGLSFEFRKDQPCDSPSSSTWC